MTGSPAADPAFSLMALDLLTSALRHAESPGELGSYLTVELRELTGARCVALTEGSGLGGPGRVLAVHPERRRGVLEQLAAGSADPSSWAPPADLGPAARYPLRVGEETKGWLVLLGLPEQLRPGDLEAVLESLATVVALALQNASHFLKQEETIAERTRALEEANAALRRTQYAMDNVTQPVCWVTPDGRLSYANAATCRLTGYAEHELLGRPVGDLYPAHSGQGWADHWAELRREGSLSFEAALRRRDGRAVPVEIQADHLALRGDEYVCAFLNDLTQARQAEAERAELERRLRQAQKMEAMGTLAGGIAHDFNNILTPVMAHAELGLLDLPEGHPARDHLERLLEAAGRAADLVRQILAVSRTEEQALAPVHLGGLVKETVKLLRSSLPPSVEIRTEVDPSCGPVLGDLSRLHQVILNLCTNSRDAMEERGGVLTLTLAREEGGGPRRLRLTVRDTGPGIPPELLDRIFEPYFTTKARGKGTGLGLATVHAIVGALGGEIRVQSRPGEGAAFDVLLPEVEGTAPGAAERPALPRGAGQRVLVVDDEPAVRDVAARMLASLGYRVEAFADGREALARLAEEPGGVEALLTDYAMPGMDGLAVAAEAQRLRPGLRVVLCTGYAESFSAAALEARGILGPLMKPYSLQRLAEALRGALAR